jgi:hypothetical protein
MNTKRTRLVAGVISAMVLSAPIAMALSQKLIFANLRGSLHVVQAVPCGDVVDMTTSIADGRMEVTVSSDLRSDGAAVRFDLMRMELFVTPFTVQHECLGFMAIAQFHEIGVTLLRPVTFAGEPIGAAEDGRYRFAIPKEQVLLFESVLDNLPVPQPETAYKRPSEDVTGVIDVRRGTAELHVTLASSLRFRVGCIGNHCVIDEQLRGTQTADVRGVMVSPTTDTDRDGVPDLTDNCPLVANGNQSKIATPLLTLPPDVTLSSCQAASIGIAEAVDVCHARPVAISNDAPAAFPIGRSLVRWSANDGVDPPISAQQEVTVGIVDGTPPTVSCTAVNAAVGSFKVVATDDCGGRTTIQLGATSLFSGEVIRIQQTGKPGVRLIGATGVDKTKLFQAGKGDAVITATDASGNTARAVCGLPSDVTRR